MTLEFERVHCPACTSADVRYCAHRRILDLVLGLVGFTALRCRACRRRFYCRAVED